MVDKINLNHTGNQRLSTALFDKESMKLMKEMMEAFGPSGFEREVNKLFKKHMTPYADEVIQDKLGSVGFVAKGMSDRPRVLVTGHTDELASLSQALPTRAT